jgi:hypothetical protein
VSSRIAFPGCRAIPMFASSDPCLDQWTS